jgi:polyisoprenoid-binding protein YceI
LQTGDAVTRFRVIPERSQVWIEARSSLHPIHGEGTGIQGEAELEVNDGQIDLSVPPKGRIELPVERLRSGNALQDMEMRRRIEAQKYPTIISELVKATALSQPNRYRLQGDLTFRGIARRLEADVAATLDLQGVLVVEGECMLDVRGFGVTPPRILGLQVYPEVKVRARVVAERRNDA